MSRQHVLIHCNGGLRFGMGHIMRSLALAAEATRQGWEVSVGGDLTDAAIAHARRVHPELEVVAVVPASLSSWIDETMNARDTRVLHLDTYWDVPDGLLGRGMLLSNVQDGDYGVRAAHLAIDPTFGSEASFARPELSDYHFLGPDATIVRQQVRRQRNARSLPHPVPRVLVVLGGTDPERLTAQVVAGLNRIDTPLEGTVVCGDDQRAAVADVVAEGLHAFAIHPFLDDLPAVAREHDLVISASGTSVWDFACMGTPMALVCAVENQARAYRTVIDAGLAHPLGQPPLDSLTDNVAQLGALLANTDGLAAQAERLRGMIDGLGTWRIVSAWEQLVAHRAPLPAHDAFIARPATLDDARKLLDWRNDPSTRAHSRTHDEVAWENHLVWLASAIDRDDRRLLVVESNSEAIGTVRWDRRAPVDWEVSITLAPHRRGQRLALPLLLAGEDALQTEGATRLIAAAHTDNPASRRLFTAAGYLPLLPPDVDGFETRAKWRFA